MISVRRIIPMLAAIVALIALTASPAQAAKLNGESTALTLSDAAKTALAANGIAAAPVAPATAAADGSLVFPIVGGRVDATTLHGFVRHSGGIKLTKGEKSAVLRRFTIVNTRRGAYLGGLALVKKRVMIRGRNARNNDRGPHGNRGRARVRFVQVYRPVRILKLSNIVRADAGGKIVVTADAALTKAAAKYLNKRLDTTVFAEDLAVGSAKVTATVAP